MLHFIIELARFTRVLIVYICLFKGNIRDEILEELITKQELAQSDDEAFQAQATMILGNHCFEVKDKGKGKYKFVLVDAWFHIQIAGGSKNKIPDVYVQISS